MSASQENLAPYYDYWDDYIRKWARGEFPDQKFMPEPWWGWTPGSKEKLHSVVINLNPGQGGKLQSCRCMNCMLGCVAATSYSLSMNLLRDHLALTERWHLNNRYRPIMLALGATENDIAPTTRHHLSIELLPNHEIQNFSEELAKKASLIYEKVLCFAAEASKKIEAPHFSKGEIDLKNVVIIRSDWKRISIIQEKLKGCSKINPAHQISIEQAKAIKVNWFTLNHPGLEDVKFVCIAGAHNHLPKGNTLNEILKLINKKLNKQ